MSSPADIWLLRHGEVRSYEGDQGLSERGIAQARAAAAELAGALPGGPVELRHAPSGRATGTAEHLRAALREHGVDVCAPIADAGFENFRVEIDGELGPHDRMRPALARVAGSPSEPVAPWALEMGRFTAIHDGGGDPIGWWLTQPTLSLEPAAVVVRRFWRALRAAAAGSGRRIVVCTHSGPMRALAAHALGRDPGEPEHLEPVVVKVAEPAAGARAELTYRGETIWLAIPRLEEPAWS